MNPKWRLWVAGGLLVAVVAAALYFPALRRQVNKTKNLPEKSTEQARRELLPPTPATSGEPRVKAKMFWGSGIDDGNLVPVTVELPLSNDPNLRAKEILNTLLAGPVDPEARTLPPDAALLAFYILPDGLAVADFSEALANSIPSGIQSEQLAVESITRTLEANVPQVQRLRILIHGQEAETLAGHLDLSQTFPVSISAPVAKPSRSRLSVLTSPFKTVIDKAKGAKHQ
jgi:spore germination protein GerM